MRTWVDAKTNQCMLLWLVDMLMMQPAAVLLMTYLNKEGPIKLFLGDFLVVYF